MCEGVGAKREKGGRGKWKRVLRIRVLLYGTFYRLFITVRSIIISFGDDGLSGVGLELFWGPLTIGPLSKAWKI